MLTMGYMMPLSTKEGEVISTSNRLDSLIIQHNAKDAHKYYAPSFVLTTSSGKKKSKEDMLQDIGNDKIQWELNQTSQVEVRIIDNTAVLTGLLHQKGKFQGKDFDNQVLVTDTWVLKDSQWLLLSGHATLLPK
jgi:hypothetical protein